MKYILLYFFWTCVSIFHLDAQYIYTRDHPVHTIDSQYIHKINPFTCDTIASTFIDIPLVANFLVHPLDYYFIFFSYENPDTYVIRFDPDARVKDTLLVLPNIRISPWWAEFLCPETILLAHGPVYRSLLTIDLKENSFELLGTSIESPLKLMNCSGELWGLSQFVSEEVYKFDKETLLSIDTLEVVPFISLYTACFFTCNDSLFITKNRVSGIDTLVVRGFPNTNDIIHECRDLTAKPPNYNPTWPSQFYFPNYSINLDLDTRSGYCEDNNAIIEYDCHMDSLSLDNLNVDYYNNFHALDSMTIQINKPNANLELYIPLSPNIQILQQGSSKIQLYNSGSSSDENFSDALRSILFIDKSALPHFETYEITVQIFECGAESVPATIFLTPVQNNLAGEDNSILLCKDDSPIDLNDLLSIDDIDLGYWENGSNIFDPSLDSPGSYLYIVDGGLCDTDTATIMVDIYPAPIQQCMDTLLCMGDSIYFSNIWIFNSGQYFDTIPSIPLGCDSLITELLVEMAPDLIQSIIDINLCSNEFFIHDGSTIQNDTIILDTLMASTFNCDSAYVEYNIKFSPLAQTFLSDTILCYGDSIMWMGNILNQSGIYEDTIFNELGCDSLLYFLSVEIEEPADIVSETNYLCFGDSLRVNSQWIITDTIITESITLSNNACDSLIKLIYYSFSKAPLQNEESITLCPEDNFNWHNQLINAAGLYFDTIPNFIGCDSIINSIEVVYLPNSQIIENEVHFCFGEEITLNDIIVSKDTSVYDTIRYTNFNCDSLIMLTEYIESQPALEISIDTILCYNTTLFIEENEISSEGLNSIIIQSSDSCDSLLYSINLNYLSEPTYVIRDTVLCFADSIYLNDAWIFDDYRFENTVAFNNYECDSLSIENIVEFMDPVQMLSPLVYDVTANVDTSIILEFSEEITNIAWTPMNGLLCDNCLNQVINIQEDMHYDLQVRDMFGCTNHFTLEFRVSAQTIKEDFYLPNIISLDDPVNSHLFLQTSTDNIINYNLFVFDRWGNLVFESLGISSNDKNSGWNGTMNGLDLSIGVYVYLIEFNNIDHKDLIGDVTIVR